MTDNRARTCPECHGPKQAEHYICDGCFTKGVRRSRPHFEDGPPVRGISDLVAVALVALRLDTVRRSTIRALCPQQGLHKETGRPVSIGPYVKSAIHRFEHRGWIKRDGDFLHVLNRDGLSRWVDQGVDIADERAAVMLSLEAAVDRINTRLDEGRAVSGWDAETTRRHAEVRRQELIALDRLMKAAPGATARRGVRVVPKGRAL